MESFIFAVNAVLPIVLMVAIGYGIKRIGLISEAVAKALNKLVFRVLLPCTLFLNVYKIEDPAAMDLGYIYYAIGITVVMFLLAFPAVMAVTKESNQRGVLIQAVFRSNFALIGIPLATSLYGEEGSLIATLLSAFIIPIFNVLAVICLTVFGDGGKPSVKKILLGILKNPLIQSIALGGICLGARALFGYWGIDFRLSDITPVYSVAEQLSKTATPIALLVLGAQFEFSAVPALKKQILFGTVLRTIIMPAIALSVAYLMGCFSGAHFAAFVALFGTPVAVSSVPMAQEMGADARVAGQLVVWTTLLSGFTIFLISFVLKALGVFS
ncbi:MAG: AEC family transporter [Clostridia bacterium]|nr:AEC family transporter [Clostridia bacterium]